jgi:hypothetical protein
MGWGPTGACKQRLGRLFQQGYLTVDYDRRPGEDWGTVGYSRLTKTGTYMVRLTRDYYAGACIGGNLPEDEDSPDGEST